MYLEWVSLAMKLTYVTKVFIYCLIRGKSINYFLFCFHYIRWYIISLGHTAVKILALGLANLIGGLFVIGHNVSPFHFNNLAYNQYYNTSLVNINNDMIFTLILKISFILL